MKIRQMKMAALLCCLISIVSFAFGAAAETNSLLPYAISFGDDIAIRMTHDGRIEATVQEYEKAEWEVFLAEGSSWYTQYTQEEYKAIMAEYDSVNSFAAMQKSSDYVDVSASCYGTLAAVHADGTVAFNKRAEDRYSTSADNSKWRNVKSIALGAYSIIAQKNDGTMIVDASTSDAFTQGVNPKNWKNVTAIDLDYLAVGLREDGRAYYAAPNYFSDDAEDFVPLKNILKWTDLVQIETAWETVVGLKTDGTVVIAGDSQNGKGNASSWTDITKVAIGGYDFVVGLKKDGTLVSTAPWALDGTFGGRDGRKLKNVVDVYANRNYVLAILSDGSTCLLGQTPGYETYDGAYAARDWVFPGNFADKVSSAGIEPAEVTPEATAEPTPTPSPLPTEKPVARVRAEAAPSPEPGDTWTCSKCFKTGQMYQFCTTCGAAKLQVKECKSCGWKTEHLDFKFCGQCGGKLSD